AETIAFNDLVEHGSMAADKEKGLVKLEGKEYIVKVYTINHFKH
ncbi:DUF933 domain-containing protein, partial [Clostridioides difficile]